jgi:enamine deaminase RidA (YjgF/YER057c/UK114 family)
MSQKALIPPGSTTAADQLKLSPGILSGRHVFLTGMTGSLPDGTMPADPETQFRQLFQKIGAVLAEAGLDFGAVVEMTSYHIDLGGHFDRFSAVRASFVLPPYPAWTAVGVAELRRPGALVEVRVIAALPAA